MRPALLALFLLFAPLSASADSFSSDDVRPQMTRDDKRLVPVVDAYVRNTRGWMVSDYTVELYRRDDEKIVFTVWYDHGDGPSILVTNNGRSFRVVVDPQTRAVISESVF